MATPKCKGSAKPGRGESGNVCFGTVPPVREG